MKKDREKKYMYGKFCHDTYEFHKELNRLFNNFLNEHLDITMDNRNDVVDLRNGTVALLDSWIGAKRFETKFGIKFPITSTPTNLENYIEKQTRIYNKKYKPCERRSRAHYNASNF